MLVLISEYGGELYIVAFYVGQWHGCMWVSFGTGRLWRNWRILSDSEEKMRQTQQFWKTKKSRDWQGKSSPMVEARWTVRKGTTDSNFYGTARWTFATHSSFNFQSWTDATTTVCWPSWCFNNTELASIRITVFSTDWFFHCEFFRHFWISDFLRGNGALCNRRKGNYLVMAVCVPMCMVHRVNLKYGFTKLKFVICFSLLINNFQ